MMSSIIVSMIERKARAPVPRSFALAGDLFKSARG